MKKVVIIIFALACLSILQKTSYAADVLTPTSSIKGGQELISAGQNFSLGFFTPGTSKSRYVGIWYKNILPQTIVWVANRDSPLNDASGNLTVAADGNIVLFDGAGNRIWFTNSSRPIQEPIAKLLDSGNLVLMDGKNSDSDSYIWQSFDYPTDTMLPGLKLGWDKTSGLNRYLTSWKSANDPSPGNFTYRFDQKEFPELVIRQGMNITFRSGIWDGIRFNSDDWLSFNEITAFKPQLSVTRNEAVYWDEPGDRLSRFVMRDDGLLQRYIWDNKILKWTQMYEARKDFCDTYGACGANGICDIKDLPAYCDCLKGFIPNSQEEWDSFNWSGGCIRRTPLNCTEGDRFQKLSWVKLPMLLQFWTNNSMSLEECHVECLKNCSCTAYANSALNEGPHGCLLWFGNLIDIRLLITEEDAGGQLDLYVRLAASEIGHRNHNEDQAPPLFEIYTILAATNNFSIENKIGEGGFGPVYRGKLAHGQEIAVKRLSKTSKQGISEFMNEVGLVAKLQHRNLVSVLGGCTQGEERMLVYEYMPNSSLDHFIFDPKQGKTLKWRKRYDIIVGIARGLLYLHQDSKLTIIHRDLKTSNILLDNELNPKISDFGVSRIVEGDHFAVTTNEIVGTIGYMSPEYAVNGLLSVKSDVFSFGVIVLEILSGTKSNNFKVKHPDHDHNLLGQAWRLWNEERAVEFMDVNLDLTTIPSEFMSCLQVGLLCVQNLPEDRPTMSSVVFMLSNESIALGQPKKPDFFEEKLEYRGSNFGLAVHVTVEGVMHGGGEGEEASDSGEEGGKGGGGVVVDNSVVHMFGHLTLLHTCSSHVKIVSSSRRMGEGGFGSVYRGKLAHGQEIAVKRLSKTSKQGISELMNEVGLVAKLQHRNLVSVLGGCTQGEERMLVYEYMANSSLDHFIFANGLLSLKSDVFSFGVIVLEILSGIRNNNFYHPDHDRNLLGQAWRLWKEGRTVEFMDVNLDLATIPSELLRCLQVGLLCVQKLPKDRPPTMSSVVFMLSNESITLAHPKKPEFTEQGLEFPGYNNNSMTITLLEARN
ncbi:hypothetical protein JHK82_041560 [Glycine max]|nr:hypothetical protein JHK86_041616 [Glycine max]KAG5104590.1 hypothetical protein JHK82_041560 [Glycine max]KAG5115714.1 hypothetical protein JHK84_041827 [Glycine max]